MARTTEINDRLAALIRAFCIDDRGLGIFEICKLTYLAEWEYLRYFGMSFSETPFIRIKYGPVFPQYKENIRRRELPRIGLTQSGSLYRYPDGIDVYETLSRVCAEPELVVMATFVRTIKQEYDGTNRNTETLKDWAYDTPPMRRLMNAEDSLGKCLYVELLSQTYYRKREDFYPDYKCNMAQLLGRRQAIKYIEDHPEEFLGERTSASAEKDNANVELDEAIFPMLCGLTAAFSEDE